MDRKYKQRGYQEEYGEVSRKDRTPRPKEPGIKHFGMRNGGTARSGVRCARCGKTIPTIVEVVADTVCSNCGAALHTCTNCSFFKTSARWECTKPITIRIERKDMANECSFFSPAVFVERTFESATTAPEDARKAFDALFKK